MFWLLTFPLIFHERNKNTVFVSGVLQVQERRKFVAHGVVL